MGELEGGGDLWAFFERGCHLILIVIIYFPWPYDRIDFLLMLRRQRIQDPVIIIRIANRTRLALAREERLV